MSVPKGKRKESQFEVIKHFYKLRKEMTDLLLRDFGYSQAKSHQNQAKNNGIVLNQKKTVICKLSQPWRYLQIQYALTESGRIIKKIHPKRLTSMRKKLKKLAGKLNALEFNNYYNSWFKNHYKNMSKKQRENMNILFDKLKEEYYV